MNHSDLSEVLNEIDCFERGWTDRQVVELAILLYNHDASLRKVVRVLGWLGVKRYHVAIWRWIQKFGQRLAEAGHRPVTDLPAVMLMTRRKSACVARSSRCLRRLIRRGAICCTPQSYRGETRPQLGEFRQEPPYGRVPPIVVIDGASYGSVFTPLGITHIVRRHSVRNRVERWIQELKRRIDTF